MEKLTNKVKTFYGWDIYELTEEENASLRPGCERKDTPVRTYYPDKTFFIFEAGENLDTVEPIFIARSIHSATYYCRRSNYPSHLNDVQALNKQELNLIREMVIHGLYSVTLKNGYSKDVFMAYKTEQNRLFDNYQANASMLKSYKTKE